jgi:hypothetical protein
MYNRRSFTRNVRDLTYSRLTIIPDFRYSYLKCEPGSSVSIVSSYGLDDRAIEVRSPQRRKNLSSSLCVQTGSGAHPASCAVGTQVLSPELKRSRGVKLTTHPHLVRRLRMSRSYVSSLPKRLRGV